jgi:hypothetical protein
VSRHVRLPVRGAGASGIAARALPWLLLWYCATSLLHFVHNAEYLAAYPGLPAWISRASVYGVWGGLFVLGLSGYLLYRRGHLLIGLALLAVYSALGFDGLLHYSRAPMAAHTLAMNLTIWSEVSAAAAALAAVLWLAMQCARVER